MYYLHVRTSVNRFSDTEVKYRRFVLVVSRLHVEKMSVLSGLSTSDFKTASDGLLELSEERLRSIMRSEPITDVYHVEQTPFARSVFTPCVDLNLNLKQGILPCLRVETWRVPKARCLHKKNTLHSKPFCMPQHKIKAKFNWVETTTCLLVMCKSHS